MANKLASNEKKLKSDRYHHGDLRAALVEATRQLIEEKGPDRFSVADACRAAGVSTAAPYRHFSDKDEMLSAAAQDAMLRLAGDERRASEGHATGSDEAIAAIGGAYVRFAMREPGMFQTMFGLAGRSNQRPEMLEAGMDCYGVLLNQIAARMPSGTSHDELKLRGFPLWTFVHGLSYLMLENKTEKMGLDFDLDMYLLENCRRLLGETA